MGRFVSYSRKRQPTLNQIREQQQQQAGNTANPPDSRRNSGSGVVRRNSTKSSTSLTQNKLNSVASSTGTGVEDQETGNQHGQIKPLHQPGVIITPSASPTVSKSSNNNKFRYAAGSPSGASTTSEHTLRSLAEQTKSHAIVGTGQKLRQLVRRLKTENHQQGQIIHPEKLVGAGAVNNISTSTSSNPAAIQHPGVGGMALSTASVVAASTTSKKLSGMSASSSSTSSQRVAALNENVAAGGADTISTKQHEVLAIDVDQEKSQNQQPHNLEGKHKSSPKG
ncbi:unnamed protein product, partial [Amoebophrya sp. A120]|eukprot:GSA120T00007598001.1